MSDINGGSVDSGSVGRRAFVARSEIENESASGPELDAALEYSSLVWVYLQWSPANVMARRKGKTWSDFKLQRRTQRNKWEICLESAGIPQARSKKCWWLFLPEGYCGLFFSSSLPISHFRWGHIKSASMNINNEIQISSYCGQICPHTNTTYTSTILCKYLTKTHQH